MGHFFSSISSMARSPRMLDNESGIVEVTARTLQGRFLTRPSSKVNEVILGIVGRAQRIYGVELYAFIFMSNHFHILMRVASAKQMAGFVGYIKTNIAKELGGVHGWKETFWGTRYHHLSLDDEDSALLQSKRLRYILSNSCKEGLVASPLDWPGVSTARALCRGETMLPGIWYDRTAEGVAQGRGERREFPSVETVRLSPLPFLSELTVAQRCEYVLGVVREIEEETRTRNEEQGTPPVGARAIERVDPLTGPDSFRPSRAPRLYAATRKRFLEMRAAHKERVAAYREAADRLREGHTNVEFPEGCFPPPAPFVGSRAPP